MPSSPGSAATPRPGSPRAPSLAGRLARAPGPLNERVAEAALLDPRFVEQPRLILGAAVAQHGDNGVTGPELTGYPHRRRDIDAGSASEQQSFLTQQAIHEEHRLGIGDTQGVVDRRSFEIRRDAA